MSTVRDWIHHADRGSPWSDAGVLVAGIGVAGYSSAAGLLQVGAQVTVVDERTGDVERRKEAVLATLGADVRLGPGATAELPAGVDLVVASPGWRPDAPLLAAATAAGIPILGELDLALRLRDPEHPAPWLALTGTNGKTTTVGMLASMLAAAGLRTAAVGNVGNPIVDAVLDPRSYDVLAVEVSATQLHWTGGLGPRAAAVLNVAPDHLEWYGGHESGEGGEAGSGSDGSDPLPGMAAYTADKGRIYTGCEIACVYNLADPVTEDLVRAAEVREGCRAIGFTRGVPDVGMVGLVDDVLADRAFVPQRRTSAAELGTLADLPSQAPHNVENALAAAALARAHGIPPVAVREGLRRFRLDHHRIEHVAEVGGVSYVDDSKATNAHAALASLRSFESVVWVAGGQAKGQRFDGLVRAVKDRLRAAVLLGVDRGLLAAALARHAPQVPVIEVDAADTEVMDRAVAEAARCAVPGDTVLLAPACASKDQFAGYDARGRAFAAAVHRLPGPAAGDRP